MSHSVHPQMTGNQVKENLRVEPWFRIEISSCVILMRHFQACHLICSHRNPHERGKRIGTVGTDMETATKHDPANMFYMSD